MCLCATWLETPFGRVQPVGYLQALPKSWPWDSREKNTARDALTQPPPPFLPQRLRAVSCFFKVTKVAAFCPYVLNDIRDFKIQRRDGNKKIA